VAGLWIFVVANNDDDDDDDEEDDALPLLNFDIIALIFTLDLLLLLLFSLAALLLLLLSFARLATASLLLLVSSLPWLLLHLPSGFMGGYVVCNMLLLSLTYRTTPSCSSPRPPTSAVGIFSAIVERILEIGLTAGDGSNTARFKG
jgi:hypothetical protein